VHNYSAPKYSSEVDHYQQANMTAKWSLVLPQYRYIDYTRMCELHNNNDQLYQQSLLVEENGVPGEIYESSANYFLPI
jgi:hypothetical protein